MEILEQFKEAADLVAKEVSQVYFDGQVDFEWIGDDRIGEIRTNSNIMYLADMVFALENRIPFHIFFEYQFTSQEQSLRHYFENRGNEDNLYH